MDVNLRGLKTRLDPLLLLFAFCFLLSAFCWRGRNTHDISTDLMQCGEESLTNRKSSIVNRQWLWAPAGIRTPNQQIMRRSEGHQQGETKRDVAVFTESAAVKVSYILLHLITPSRHNRAI